MIEIDGGINDRVIRQSQMESSTVGMKKRNRLVRWTVGWPAESTGERNGQCEEE